MGRPSDKSIIDKLEKIKKSAEQHNNFKVAAKFELRINEFKKKKQVKNGGF